MLENVEIFKNSHDAGFLAAGDLRIDCNPQPELIYSKTGDLIETVYPILHPMCDDYLGDEIIISSSAPELSGATAAEAEAEEKARRRDRNDRRERAARRKAEEAAEKSSRSRSRRSKTSTNTDPSTGSGTSTGGTSSTGSKPSASKDLSGCGSKPCKP